MKTLFLPILLILTFSFQVVAQQKSRHEKRGDKYLFAYSYAKAIKHYKKSDALTVDGQRNLASGYSKTDQHILSSDTYKLVLANPADIKSEDYYNCAMVYKSLGNYAEAGIWMDKFLLVAPNDLRAKSYYENKAMLTDLITHNPANKVERLAFNTDAQEFGPSYYKSNIAYSSSKNNPRAFKHTNNQNGKPYLDVYVGKLNGAELEEREKFDKQFRTKYHDGPVSFSKNDMYMAYTRNAKHDRSKDKITELQIWFSTFNGEKWSKESAFTFNNPAYSVGHPNLTEDGNTLYFVSDMPGGFGKADIYKSTKNETGEWNKPVNLGNKINTESDELFPFFDEKNNVLCFTSDGHFGLGGMDLFMAPMHGSTAHHVVNPGAPVNTKHDDYAMILDENMKTGYFSSNRNGADDDIYSVNFTEGSGIGKRLEGIATDKNGAPLIDVTITLTDTEGNVVDSSTTLAAGSYTFFVADDANFKLSGVHKNYLDASTITNTHGDDYVIFANLTLQDKTTSSNTEENTAVEEEVVVDFGNTIVFKPIYFELNKFDITPEAAKELDNLVAVMNKNPEMVVELSSFSDCRDSESYNQALSEKRAKATLNYIQKRITNPSRISGKGYGESAPVNNCVGEGTVVSDCTEAQHSKNRRTEFTVVTITTIYTGSNQ